MAVDEKYLYTGSFDNTIVVWDKTKPLVHRILAGHADRVRCLCVDEKFVYSGSFDGTIRIWDKIVCKISGQTLRSAERKMRQHVDFGFKAFGC